MKWQIISYYPDKETSIKHYRLLKIFGARLFLREEIGAWEFRFAQFGFGYCSRPLQMKYSTKIPIPFMRNDYYLRLHKSTGKKNDKRRKSNVG